MSSRGALQCPQAAHALRKTLAAVRRLPASSRVDIAPGELELLERLAQECERGPRPVRVFEFVDFADEMRPRFRVGEPGRAVEFIDVPGRRLAGGFMQSLAGAYAGRPVYLPGARSAVAKPWNLACDRLARHDALLSALLRIGAGCSTERDGNYTRIVLDLDETTPRPPGK